jgi:hypothetical protein
MTEYLRGQNLPAFERADIWDNPYGPGLRIVTKHYEIYTTWLDPLVLRQVPSFMESAYKGYNDQLPHPIETKTRFTVYLFGGRKQWEDFTATFAGSYASMYSEIEAGAYYLNGATVAYNIGRERTFRAMGHEGWHQFNSRHFRFRLPSWLDEGAAMLFETCVYENGMFICKPGRNVERLAELRKTMLDGKMIPLRKLTALNPGELIMSASPFSRTSTNDEQVQDIRAFYSQCHALILFLRSDDYGKRLNKYHRLLLDGLHGDWPLSENAKKIAADRNVRLTVGWNRVAGPKLFEYYIGEDMEEIEREYEFFCSRMVYRIRIKEEVRGG